MSIIEHQFEPIYDAKSKILILGTFPSVKSREMDFYYSHPQNRFWKVISRLTDTELPITLIQKKTLLLGNCIALYDVIFSCEIDNSSDNSIKNITPVDLSTILESSYIVRIFANGDKAYKVYLKYLKEKTDIDIVKLPSTSPANAACSLEKLVEQWSIIQQYL